MEYQLLYKCRLCGAIAVHSCTKTRKVAMESMLCMCANRAPLDPTKEIEPIGVHTCEDGSLGVMDCLGFREVEDT